MADQRLEAVCDSCFHQFSVGAHLAGKRVRCPECKSPVSVSEGDSDVPVRKPRSKSRKSRPEKNQNGLIIGLAAGIGGIAVVAVVVAVVMSRPAAAPATTAPMVGSASMAQGMPGMHGMMSPGAPGLQAQANADPQHVPATVPLVATNVNPTPSNDASTVVKPADSSASAEVKTKPAENRVKLDMVELIAKVEPSVVRILTKSKRGASVGSGFVVDTKGTIVTNVHVIAGAQSAEVEFSNGIKAPVIGFHYLDQKKDIAILKIDLPPEKLTPVPLAMSLPPKGTAVVSFGAPHGLSFTSTGGNVSALRPAEEMQEKFGPEFEGDWIQTDTPISPGNSGGPLVNHFGEVVAMNTMQMTVGQNLNFAMSSVDVADAVSKAPAEFKPISADLIKPPSTSRQRNMASDETETERGKKLLSEITEIFLVNATSKRTLILDPTGMIWDKVIAKSEKAVEKSKIRLSFLEPSDDAAIMFVILELKNSVKANATQGTQDLFVTVELICKDANAKADETPICRLWKAQENLGSIKLSTLQSGVYPRTVEENLNRIFTKFKGTFNRVRQGK